MLIIFAIFQYVAVKVIAPPTMTAMQTNLNVQHFIMREIDALLNL